MGHFAESIDDDQDGVQLTPSPGQTQDEVKADFLPRRIRNGEGEVLSSILLCQIANSAGGAAAYHLANVAA